MSSATILIAGDAEFCSTDAMKPRINYVFFFSLGLLVGLFIEPHVLRLLDPSGQFRSSDTTRVGSNRTRETSSLGDSKSVSSSSEAGPPKISVDNKSFNFGDRDAGDIVEHSFTLANSGRSPLEILNVVGSCGCTSTKLSSKSIPPGGNVTLHVKLDLHMQKGKQHRTILVNSNDPSEANLTLELVGNSVSLVVVDPPLISVEPSKDQVPHTSVVRVVAEDKIKALNITQVVTSGKDIEAELETMNPGKEYAVKVKILSEDTPSELKGWVRLLSDHPGEYKEILIPIVASSEE